MTKKSDTVRDIAQQALVEIASDPDAPSAARASAARTLLEMEGAIGRNQTPPSVTEDRPLSSLSRADLEAELSRLQGNRVTGTTSKAKARKG
jgi:hypothetical protein